MQGPTVWLGQSVDTSSLCALHPDFKKAAFLTSLGCAIRKSSLIRTHFNGNLRFKLGVEGPLMIDSGGFALSKNKNVRWSWKTVARLFEGIDADVFVSLDHPPHHSDTKADRIQKIKTSVQNYKKLLVVFPGRLIMPVVHGRALSEIELSIELVLKMKTPTWVGLGGLVPLLQNQYVSGEIARLSVETFIAKSLRMVREAFPKARLHTFGAGGTQTFPALYSLGADSADSIGWRQAAGFGSIFLPLKSQRVIIWKGNKPPRRTLDETDLEDISRCRCPTCREAFTLESKLEALRKGFNKLAIHNAWIVSNQVKFWPKGRSAMKNALGEGKLGARWAKTANLQ